MPELSGPTASCLCLTALGKGRVSSAAGARGAILCLQKSTKTAMEVARTFATMFSDITFRQKLLKTRTEEEFKEALVHQRQLLTMMMPRAAGHSMSSLHTHRHPRVQQRGGGVVGGAWAIQGQLILSFLPAPEMQGLFPVWERHLGGHHAQVPCVPAGLHGRYAPSQNSAFQATRPRAPAAHPPQMPSVLRSQASLGKARLSANMSPPRSSSTSPASYRPLLLDPSTMRTQTEPSVRGWGWSGCARQDSGQSVVTSDLTASTDVQKTIAGQSIGGLLYALFSGQPLVILLTTAPLAIYTQGTVELKW